VKTIEAHRANIMRKLHLRSVSDLVRYANPQQDRPALTDSAGARSVVRTQTVSSRRWRSAAIVPRHDDRRQRGRTLAAR
jgi:hypothetical protein